MSTTKTASPAVAAVGGTVTFTITPRNNGPSPVTQPITVTDTLPSELSFVSATGTNWSCSHSGGVVTCTYTSATPIASSSNLSAITLQTTVTAAGAITNTATTTIAAGLDPNSANDSGTASSTVTSSSADMAITKAGSPSTVNADFPLT